MLGRNQKSAHNELHNSNSIIGEATTLKGGIDTTGNLRIEGSVIGDIKCNSKIASNIS